MQEDLKTEVILCPNCKEEVPKTLYCLNCGYPLYKVEQEEARPEGTEIIGIEGAPEPIETAPSNEPEVEMPSIPEEATEIAVEPEEEEAETLEEPQIISVEEEEKPAEELTEAVTAQWEAEVEVMQVQEPVVEESTEIETMVPEEEPTEEAEVEVMQVQEPEMEESTEEAQETPTEFEPDPLVIEVMEKLVKSISLRVRLANLLREGDVKEATFTRLFESYGARGERWMKRRNEMLERNRYDLDEMEKALTEARMGLEELEIRKAIGDVSEGEYQAKAPAFEWDIRLLDDELRRRKGEIAYLMDLAQVISASEAQDLREMAESCNEDLDGLVESGRINSETAARVKAALGDALKGLNG